jgi:hypothetical protein
VRSTKGITLSLTKHAKKQAKAKDFPISEILNMWEGNPNIVPSRSYRGQYRVCGNGICLVGVPKEKSFIVITVYLDQELTPPRPDQLITRTGRRYAKRFASGEGRG